MLIPHSVKVGSLTYKVTRGPKMHHDDIKAWGITDHESQVIQLQEGMSKEREAETFLHELMHCAMATCGIGYALEQNRNVSEEELVNGTSRMLYQIITDNKLVF